MLKELDVRGDLKKSISEYLPRPFSKENNEEIVAVVRGIIKEVRERGDEALYEMTERFDGSRPATLSVGRQEMEDALEEISPELRVALEKAAENVRNYYSKHDLSRHEITRDGMSIKSQLLPLRSAGCYVPGGKASYPSTVIMTAIPAEVAGVERIVVAVPPNSEGRIPQSVLAAAALAGVQEVHPMGGAQAIAALAYGTEEVEPVDVIVGPGNIYVSLAKQEVSSKVRVPASFAGPSEVVVVADETASPDLVALDLIVQAEHGPDGLSWLVTWEKEFAEKVHSEITRILETSIRKEEIESTLSRSGYCVLVEGQEQALEVVNIVAPEHLQIMTRDPEVMAAKVRNAGAIFCGSWSPAALGDYIAGPSHVLPTAGTARFSGALSVADFLKEVHVISASKETISTLGIHAVVLAETEGLDAHAESIRRRMKKIAEEENE